jgi:intracellular sulfur oxidation DsrE/DsrF family protein
MKNLYALVVLALSITAVGVSPAAGAAERLDVVYHLSDADKVGFVLDNIRNHIKGVGGPQNVNIVLVVHGPALKAFQDIEALDSIRDHVKALQGDGVEFDACGNTMKALDVGLDELLPNFVQVDQGGVVRIAELQAQGYIYIRP